MKDIHKNDRVVALLAGAMALISLSVAIWDGFETRNHNRLSVRPNLSFNTSTTSSTTTDAQKTSIIKSKSTISVINKGLGPAIINSFKIITLVNDKRVIHNDWVSALKAINNRQQSNHTGTLGDNSVLRADESTILVTLDTSATATASLKIEIVYRSIYEEEFVESTGFIEI